MKAAGIVAAICLVFIGGCARREPDTASEANEDDIASAVCDALALLPEGVQVARSSFMRNAHEGLHTLAQNLIDTQERALASRLLEAKQSVEALFERTPLKEHIQESLVILHRASQSGMEALGEPISECPQAQ